MEILISILLAIGVIGSPDAISDSELNYLIDEHQAEMVDYDSDTDEHIVVWKENQNTE